MYSSLINASELEQLIAENSKLLLFDCSYDLKNPNAGRENWVKQRIADAAFLHIDEDLSGEIISGKTGRHPLPSQEDFLKAVKDRGYDVAQTQQIVVYDNKFGAIAARAWWMFKWIGHERVAVLEGGYPAWEKFKQASLENAKTEGLKQTAAGISSNKQTKALAVDRGQVEDIRQSSAYCLIDSRTPERYRGEHEPIDPVAGHIEGAINLPWPENLDENGNFKSIAELKNRFTALKQEAVQNVFYCGSGVTACHNILAYYHAFGTMPRLYPGSWSEWII